MLHNWVQGRTLHLAILNSLDVPNNFHHDLFPVFSVAKIQDGRIATCWYYKHEIEFSDVFMMKDVSQFSHVYFHELIHSGSKYTNRWERFWSNASPDEAEHIVGLEERIADLGAMILALRFDYKFKYKNIERAVTKFLEYNPTKYALPWQDFTEAVLFYVRNKDCPVLNETLQLFKQIILDNDLTTIYEGRFDGTLSKKSYAKKCAY
jgi:hypothetical protein